MVSKRTTSLEVGGRDSMSLTNTHSKICAQYDSGFLFFAGVLWPDKHRVQSCVTIGYLWSLFSARFPTSSLKRGDLFANQILPSLYSLFYLTRVLTVGDTSLV